MSWKEHMMDFKAEDGTIITDEIIEKMAESWDRGDLYGAGGEIVRGRPRLSVEPLEVISFKVPKSLAVVINRAARERGESRSVFLRNAAAAEAKRTLS